MKEQKKGLSTFTTALIAGCGLGFAGIVLSNTPWIWTGLVFIVVGFIAEVLEKK